MFGSADEMPRPSSARSAISATSPWASSTRSPATFLTLPTTRPSAAPRPRRRAPSATGSPVREGPVRPRTSLRQVPWPQHPQRADRPAQLGRERVRVRSRRSPGRVDEAHLPSRRFQAKRCRCRGVSDERPADDGGRPVAIGEHSELVDDAVELVDEDTTRPPGHKRRAALSMMSWLVAPQWTQLPPLVGQRPHRWDHRVCRRGAPSACNSPRRARMCVPPQSPAAAVPAGTAPAPLLGDGQRPLDLEHRRNPYASPWVAAVMAGGLPGKRPSEGKEHRLPSPCKQISNPSPSLPRTR